MSSDAAPQAPAGWYPHADAPGGQRYWDGERWHDTPAPSAPAATAPTAPTAPSGPSGPVTSTVVRPAPGQVTRAERAVGVARWGVGTEDWRRWSGRNWLPAMYSRDPAALRRREGPFGDPALAPEKRSRFLDKAVAEEVLRGGTLLLREQHAAVLSYKRPVRHWMHALLSVLTLGLWTTVWLIMAVARKEDRVRLEVDEWGNVWGNDLPR